MTGNAIAQTAVERGEYIVGGIAGCGNCHTPIGPDGFIMEQELAGRLVEKNEAFTAIAPNITPGSRIASWRDEDLVRAIREGLRPDGSLIGPPMPFTQYRGLSDTDVNAIVAFLRTVPAVESTVAVSEYRIPWQPIVGMRNRLVHAYFDIDADILWVAATQEVPALLPKLQALMSVD